MQPCILEYTVQVKWEISIEKKINEEIKQQSSNLFCFRILDAFICTMQHCAVVFGITTLDADMYDCKGVYFIAVVGGFTRFVCV